MDWSEQTLKRIYEAGYHDGWQDYPNRPTVCDQWPYHGGSVSDIDARLHEVADHLEDSDLISAEADFSSFGSGYASFADIFCSKKDGSSRMSITSTGEKICGIHLYVSHLAPVAAYGAGERSRHANGGSSTFLDYESVGTMPPGEWESVLAEIAAKLKADGIEIADAKTLNETLPFEAKIETNLGDYPHRVFDLLFYWYD